MSNVNVFINHVGQTILAEKGEASGDSLVLKNPAVLHVTPNSTGQLQVQLIPYFFREFLDPSARNDGIKFTFNRNQIVESDAKLEPKITDQYTRLFSVVPAKPSTTKDTGVIKLFDE